MADTPILPSDESPDNPRQIRSIERDIASIIKNQNDLLKEKASLSKSIQEQLKSQNIESRDYMLNIQKEMITLNNLIEEQVGLEGTNLDTNKHQIKSVQDRIKLDRELIDLGQARMALAIQADKEQQAESNKRINIVKKGLQEITGLDLKEFTMVKKISDEILSHGIESKALAYSIGAIVMMLKGALDLFKKMDAAAWDFRKAMGMTRMESAVIRKDAESLAIDYMAMGVTIDQVYKSYQAIGQTVGGVHNVTKDMARDVSLMASQFGISEETSAGFMRNLAAVSQSTMESQQNMLGLAQSLSSAAGVPLNDVMKDVSSKSENTLMLMSRMPTQVVKTATELRRMGTNMDAVANAGAHVLDFQNSMNDEMDASVLLGKSINFQQVRQLTYQRDLEGAAKKTVDLAEQNGFLHKMDYFQMQAFSKLSGYTVDQLTQMVQTREQMENIRRNGTPQQKAELAAYEKMRKENDATLKARAKDAMFQIRTMANQQRIVQIQNKWNELLAKVQQFLLPTIDKMLGGIVKYFGVIKWVSIVIGSIWLANKVLMLATEMSSWRLSRNMLLSAINSSALGRVLTGLIAQKKVLNGFSIDELKTIKSSGTLFQRLLINLKLLGPWVGRILPMVGTAIMGSLSAIGTAIAGAAVAIGSFIMSIPALAIAVAAGIGVAIGYGLRKLFPSIDTFTQWLWLKLFKVWDAIVDGIKYIGPLLITNAKRLGHFMWEGITSYFHMWASLGGMVLNAGKYLGKLLWKGLSTYFHVWASIGKLIWKGITSYFHMWTSLGHVVFNGAKHLGDMIFNGLKSVKDKIVDVLQHPFRSAWNGIKKLWGGHSPSQLGLSILTGIQSVGGMMHKALTSPFHNGIKDIMKKIGDLKKHATISQPSSSVEARIKAAYIPAVTVSPSGTKIETSSTPKPSAAKGKDKSSATLDDVLDALNTQNKLLEKILAKDPNIKMDGSLLSTTLARNTEFRGSFGTNR